MLSSMTSAPITRRADISPEKLGAASRELLKPLPDFTAEAQPWEIKNRLNLSEEELSIGCLLLDAARHQQFFAASPLLSEFKVGSGVYCGEGKMAVGANLEYGAGSGRAYDEGVHSEEAAFVSASNRFGRDTTAKIVAVTTDALNPSTPCGKCRSIIETYANGDPIYISAGSGNSVEMWRLSELLPNKFSTLSQASLAPHEAQTLQKLLDAAYATRGVSFTHFSRKTLGISVAAIAAGGEIFSLPRVDVLAFYGTSSLRATIARVLGSRPSKLQAVLISCASGLPVCEDRQLLYEFASFYDQTENLPVYLHSETAGTFQVTSPGALLPYAFGPKDLGINLTQL
jgi:cytidine deaminase